MLDVRGLVRDYPLGHAGGDYYILTRSLHKSIQAHPSIGAAHFTHALRRAALLLLALVGMKSILLHLSQSMHARSERGNQLRV